MGLSFVSHGFAKHPVLAFAGYTALMTVGVGHVVWGWAKWIGVTPSSVKQLGAGKKRANRRWWMINGVVALLAGVWMAGGLGIVGRGGRSSGWIGKGFDEIYSHIPMLKL